MWQIKEAEDIGGSYIHFGTFCIKMITAKSINGTKKYGLERLANIYLLNLEIGYKEAEKEWKRINQRIEYNYTLYSKKEKKSELKKNSIQK